VGYLTAKLETNAIRKLDPKRQNLADTGPAHRVEKTAALRQVDDPGSSTTSVPDGLETNLQSLFAAPFVHIQFWDLGNSIAVRSEVRRSARTVMPQNFPALLGDGVNFISWLPMFKPKTEVLPVAEIRKHFPALERIHNGFPVAYFDGPGGTQVPRYVVEQMSDYLYHHNANTHWAYPTSAETDAAIEHAREVSADFLNASPNEIAFGANMTTLTFHLSRALGLNYSSGDEIVVTELDHHANIDPWRRLAVERGVTIRTVRLDTATGQLSYEDLERFVGPKTRLVAIGAASNALGTINDLARIVELAHTAGALVFVDAVHYAPHAFIDVKQLDCDFLGMSAYKFYGPHIGILWGKAALLREIDFPKLVPAPDYIPENAETGTQNQEGMVGAAAAIDFLASLGGKATRRENLQSVFAETHARNAQLFARLWQGLSSTSGVTVYGPPPDAARTPTVAFTIAGCTSTEAARRLAEKGLFLSHGDFYAWTVVQRFGLEPEGFIRAGCACYTTEEEIERLIAGVADLC
jgi:cysteine desulfurase family protein (TIGR01976 family)